MRIAKYIVSSILLAAICVFIMEGYMQCVLAGFESDYATVAVKPEAGTTVKDADKAAKEHGVECFINEYQREDFFSETDTLYCTAGMESILREFSLVKKGIYDSLIFGRVEIRVRPLEKFADAKGIVEYSVYGAADDVYHFSEEVGGSVTRKAAPGRNPHEYTSFWLIILFSTTMLTLYDIALLRKETLIRLVSGQDLKWFAGKRAAMDGVFYGLCFFLSLIVCGWMSSAEYYFENSAFWMLLIGGGNAALSFTLLLTDYKKDAYMGLRAKRILKISYIYKTVSVLITLAIFNGCAGAIAGGFDFYGQKQIFQDHKDYSYFMVSTSMDSDDIDRSEMLGLRLYKDYLKQGKTFAMAEINDLSTIAGDYIYADAGTVPYLRQQIPELRNVDFGQQAYFIFPSGTKASEKKSLKEAFDTYYSGDYDFQEIEYTGNTELLACDGSVSLTGVGTTKLKENPPIALNCITGAKVGAVDQYVLQSAMLDITDEELREFTENHALEGDIIYKTNAYKDFYHQWKVKRSGMILAIALMCAMFLIEMSLIYNVLSYEFHVNARELALRKTLGHPLLERYGRLVSMTLSCTILGGVCAVAASYFLDTGVWDSMILGTGAVILVEAALIVFFIRKLERRNIQRILKGSVL